VPQAQESCTLAPPWLPASVPPCFPILFALSAPLSPLAAPLFCPCHSVCPVPLCLLQERGMPYLCFCTYGPAALLLMQVLFLALYRVNSIDRLQSLDQVQSGQGPLPAFFLW